MFCEQCEIRKAFCSTLGVVLLLLMIRILFLERARERVITFSCNGKMEVYHMTNDKHVDGHFITTQTVIACHLCFCSPLPQSLRKDG